MNKVEFNLLDEPWIRVRVEGAQVREVSLADALVRAHEYRELRGETAAQDVAVLRLLLAVLYSVFLRVDETGAASPIGNMGDAIGRWRRLWEAGMLPGGVLGDYFSKWHERFWLFHPEHPFYQIPSMGVGTSYTASKLNGELSESNNKKKLFSLFDGEAKERLSYAQAARWLLYLNAFDDNSGKPTKEGKKAAGGTLPSARAGWVGRIGPIFARGESLFETLMLNLCLLQDGQKSWPEGRPSWELDHPRCEERVEIPAPASPAELLTVQSRRLALARDAGYVVGFCSLGGDVFPGSNVFAEQWTVWDKPTKDKNAHAVVTKPKCHDPSRQFWREFPNAFPPDSNARTLDRDIRTPPGVVSWIRLLRRNKALDGKKLISFKYGAVVYGGNQNSLIDDVFSDELSFHLGILSEMNNVYKKRISVEVEKCEEAAESYSIFMKDLALASGYSTPKNKKGKSDLRKTRDKEAIYIAFDRPFRRWLEGIDPDSDRKAMDENIKKWHKDAFSIVKKLAEDAVESLGARAITGKMIEINEGGGSKKTYHISAPEAMNRLLSQLKKIYG